MSKAKQTIKKQPLTPNQKDLLDWIVSFIKKEGRAPGTNEMADAFKTEKSNVSRYVSTLVDKGYLTRDPEKTFSIEVVP